MKTLAWKIEEQFIKQGRGYRQIYDQYKDRITKQRLPIGKCLEYEKCLKKLTKAEKPSCVGHIHRMACRYAVKMFISDLWVMWRRLEGLPVSDPWVIAHGGHAKLRDLDEFLRNEAAEPEIPDTDEEVEA